jgi:HEAT repeats
MSSDRSRELRDARAAIERLALAHSAAATEMRPALIAATTDAEPTTRGNAIFFLQQLGPDEEPADWLRPRLRDENDVVRRWAAQAAETLELDELRDDVAAAYDAEADELAAEALAIALFALTPETDRLSALRELMANRVGWGPRRPPREKIALSDALSLLEEGGIASFPGWGPLRNLQSGTRGLAATLPEGRRKGASPVEALHTVRCGLIEQLDEWQALV